MLTVNAYAATSPTDPLTPARIERRDLGPHDVLINEAYDRVLASDVRYRFVLDNATLA